MLGHHSNDLNTKAWINQEVGLQSNVLTHNIMSTQLGFSPSGVHPRFYLLFDKYCRFSVCVVWDPCTGHGINCKLRLVTWVRR